MKNNKIIIGLLILLLVGIGITYGIGLNVGLKYKESPVIEMYVGKQFETNDIEAIAKEVFETKSKATKIEIYEDMFSLKLDAEVSDEKLETFINKINEKYETEMSKESVLVKHEGNSKLVDMGRRYVFPIVLIFILIFVYYIIVGLLKRLQFKDVLINACYAIILNILLFGNLLTFVAIFRIEVGEYIFAIMLTYLTITVGIISNLYNKTINSLAEMKKKTKK